MKRVMQIVTVLTALFLGSAAVHAQDVIEDTSDATSLQGELIDLDLDADAAAGPYLGRVYDCYWVIGVGLRSNQCAYIGQSYGYYAQWLVGLGGTVCDCYGYY